METTRMKWTGIRPIIMHNGELADPMNQTVREIKNITSKGSRKMTDTDYACLQRLEWEGSLYWDDEHGPYIPNDNIERCLQLGAQKSRMGKEIQSVAFVMDDIVKLSFNGPKEKEKLFQPNFILRKGVSVNKGSRTIRVRPRFPVGWSINFTVEFDDQIVDRASIIKAAIDAGARIGLGDWRPKYGRFDVEVMD